MDAVASGMLACRTKALQRTAKSCGPGAATLASSRRNDLPVTVAKQAAHRGEHEVSRKTIARSKATKQSSFLCCSKAGLLRFARNDGVDGPRRHLCARLVMSIRPDKGT